MYTAYVSSTRSSSPARKNLLPSPEALRWHLADVFRHAL
jgi:hypothetical protein